MCKQKEMVHLGKMSRGLLLMLICIVTFVGDSSAQEEKNKPFRIVYAEEHISHRLAVAVLAKAYRSIEVDAEFVARPNRRSLAEANSGRFDGEAGRIPGVNKRFPNLVQLSTPVVAIEAVPFSLSSEIDITHWDDLQQYRVGIIRGELYAERALAKQPVVRVNNYQELIELLRFDRIDVAVGIKNDALAELSRQGADDVVVSGSQLFTAKLYPILTKSNQVLAEPLDRELQRMQQSGVIDEILASELEAVLKEVRVK